MWMIPLWTLVLAALLAWLTPRRFRQSARFLAAGLAIGALIPWLPSSHAEAPRKPSTQVIYRFDDHRYLEMEGYGCEGAIYYIDSSRDIRSSYIEQFARVFLPPIKHADNDGDFVFLPYSDISGFAVSKDRGKSFHEAHWVGDRPNVKEVKAITVVNQQAFIETKDGRVFMTSKPFGKRWGLDVIDAENYLPQTTLAEWPNFQNLPTKVPEVKDYQGWTEMHCDPDLQGEPKETSGTRWNAFQHAVLALLGRTAALPVTWAVRAIG